MQLLQMVTSVCLGFDRWRVAADAWWCVLFACAALHCRLVGFWPPIRTILGVRVLGSWHVRWLFCVLFGGLVLVVFILDLIQVCSSQVGAGAHKVP
jgi:hypothetical protein